MTTEATKQLKDTMREMYNAGVDDALNLVAAVLKTRIKTGMKTLSDAKLLELIETSRENFKGK